MQTGSLKQTTREALLDAFRRPGEMSIVVSNAGLKTSFTNYLAVPGTTYEEAVFNLLEWVESQSQLIPFLQAAGQENNGNPKLRVVLSKLEPLEKQYHALRPDLPLGEAERIVLKGVAFEDAAVWLAQLTRMRRAVCRVEPQPQAESLAGYGTGFLVAPDVVMTNFHVAEAFWDNPAKTKRVKLWFDFETEATGVGVSKGTEHTLALEWLAKPATGDEPKHPWQCLSSPVAHLDFALLRLAKPAGDETVDGSTRGFLQLTARAFNATDPILILQHPAAAPLKVSFGAVEEPVPPNQVLYKVNTEGGSSGSPCLTQDLKVSAIHHYGLVTNNRGVTHEAILSHLAGRREQLKALGLEHLIA
jgi:hypothetical protein